MKVANWYFVLGLLALVVALPTSVGAWSYEQIEGPGNWAWMELEVMPSGTICICYQNSTTGDVCVSRRDTAWHTDSLGSWPVFFGRHLTFYPGSQPAVLLREDSALTYAVHSDSGWTTTRQSWAPGPSTSFLAFDSSGNPAVLYYSAWYEGPFLWEHLNSAYFRGDTWATDLVAEGSDMFHSYVGYPTDFRRGADDLFYFDWWESYLHPPEAGSAVAAGVTGSWNISDLGGGCISLAPKLDSGYSFCYDSSGLCCDGELVDSAATSGVLRVDALGRRQIVYRCGVLKYAYNTLQWYVDTLPGDMNAASAYDFATDLNSLPLIAFIRDSSVFLATGDAVGVSEKKPQVVPEPLRLPTIVRGVLFLPRPLTPDTRSPTALLDISGRKVLDLHAGANDVSHLAPGVYFVRNAADGRAQKVVIER